MKKRILFTALFFTTSSHAQLITLFEAGTGASQGVAQGFGGIIAASADESGSAVQYAGVWSDTLRVLFYNSTPSGADFWVTKRVPQMEIYAQLELFADMTLPATDADFYYSVSTDSITWNTVPLAEANAPFTFDNSAGNKYLRLNVRLESSDSVQFSFNYISVKADTNYFVGLKEQPLSDCTISAFGQTITVSTEQSEGYTIAVYDLNGKAVFAAAGSGSQAFGTSDLNGIYLVNVRSGNRQLTQRCYFGE